MTLFLKFKLVNKLARVRAALLGALLTWGAVCFSAPMPAGAQPDWYRDAMLAVSEGRFSEAEKLLILLAAGEPRHAGAWLDLAMLYCAAGNAQAAENLFTEVERRFDPPPSILQVIALQRQLGCKGWQARTDVSVRLGRGFETNANQGARNPNFSVGSGVNQVDLVLLPEYQPRSDALTTLSAEWGRELAPGGASGVVQFQSRVYDELSSFSTHSLFVGAERSWRWGTWGFRGVGSLGMMTLDKRLYLQQRQLQLEALAPSPLPTDWQWGVAGHWSAINYPTLSGFDAQLWEARSTLRYRRDDVFFQTSVSALQDRQRGGRPGGNRLGVFADAQGRMALSSRVQGELGLQWQRWQGDDVYSPGLIDVRRVQNTRVLRAAAVFQVDKQQSLVLELKEVRNDENVSIFNYRNVGLQLSWQWQPLKTR